MPTPITHKARVTTLFPAYSQHYDSLEHAKRAFLAGRVVDRVRALLTMPVTARTTVPLLARFPQLLVIEEIPPGMIRLNTIHRFSLVGPHSAYCRHRWGKLPSQ